MGFKVQQVSVPPNFATDVNTLKNNELKVTYYEVVSGTSGTITPPSQTTFNSDEFGASGNAVLSEIDGSNKPTFVSPQTSTGTTVTVSLDTATGDWVSSGVYTSPFVAIIYSLNVKSINYSNLAYNNIVGSEPTGGAAASLTLEQVLAIGNITGAYDIVLSNGKKIASVNGNGTVDFGSGTYAALGFDDGTNSGGVSSRAGFTALSHTDGSDDSSITVSPGDIELQGTGLIGLDAASIGLNATGSISVASSQITNDHVLVVDSSGNMVTSSVTTTELDYLSGATSNIQDQIDAIGGGGAWGSITGTLSDQTDLQSALNAKENISNKTDTMAGNTASSTKYLSAKGVYDWVTSLGYQAALTAANFGTFISGLTSKTTPVDADSISIVDSAASNVQKKVSLTDFWTNYIKGKADAQYGTLSQQNTNVTNISVNTTSITSNTNSITKIQKSINVFNYNNFS